MQIIFVYIFLFSFFSHFFVFSVEYFFNLPISLNFHEFPSIVRIFITKINFFQNYTKREKKIIPYRNKNTFSLENL